MPIPSQREYDKQHLEDLDKYAKQIRASYLKIIKKVSKLGNTSNLNRDGEFYFQGNSSINNEVNALLKQLYTDVYGTTVTGITTEWDVAVEKNNEIAQWVFGKSLDELPNQYKTRYLSNNSEALRAFIQRKQNGLGLSDRVWRNTRQFKKELELALELGIGEGKSAASIAKNIQENLINPDELYRRVRNKENGILRLSKSAKAYNPGQGVSRSSYKNAFRLARNEINFSYEMSQQEKRKQQDFVVGVKIKTSPSHNPKHDKGGVSCRSLQGLYPKDFDFSSKWHVNCKCLSLTIVKTREELDKDTALILKGRKPNTPSINEVKGLPKNFTGYIKNNSDKWSNWKNQPRFLVNT